MERRWWSFSKLWVCKSRLRSPATCRGIDATKCGTEWWFFIPLTRWLGTWQCLNTWQSGVPNLFVKSNSLWETLRDFERHLFVRSTSVCQVVFSWVSQTSSYYCQTSRDVIVARSLYMRLLGPAGFEGGVGRMVFLDLQRQWAVGKYNKHPVRRKPGKPPPRIIITEVLLYACA